MIFNRTVLIDRVKAEIERREQAAKEKTAEAAATYDYDRRVYVESTADAWNGFANLIKRRLRSGQPVTGKDVPAQLGGHRQWNRDGGYLSTWNDRGPTVHTPDVAALQTLLALLEANLVDKVSTSELERMGFKMAQLFRTH